MFFVERDFSSIPGDPWKAAKVAKHPDDVIELLRRFAESKKAHFSGYWAGSDSTPMILFSWGVKNEKLFDSFDLFLKEIPWFKEFNPDFHENSEALSCINEGERGKQSSVVIVRRTYIAYLPPIEQE